MNDDPFFPLLPISFQFLLFLILPLLGEAMDGEREGEGWSEERGMKGEGFCEVDSGGGGSGGESL